MNDEKNKPVGIPVYSKSTGSMDIRQPAKRQDVSTQVRAERPLEVLPELGTEGIVLSVLEATSSVTQETPTTSLLDVAKIKDKEKDQKVESLADFIAHFYMGKTKSLGDSTLRKVVKNSRIEDVRRYELLALAEENDPTLEKSLNLMLLAADLSGYRSIEDQLRFFAAEIGRRVRGQGKLSLESWLPRSSEEGLGWMAVAVEAREVMQTVVVAETLVADKKRH